MGTNVSGTTSSEGRRESVQVDWAHLPSGVSPISLWESLHDGELISMHSDLRNRSLSMRFHVDYVLEFHNLPEGLDFIFDFVNVKSVRATRWQPWPGEAPDLNGLPYAEQERLRSDYHAKWREESDSWQAFEEGLMTGQFAAPDISHAELARDRGSLALRVQVEIEDREFKGLTIAADDLTIRRSDDQTLSLEEFLTLRSDYRTAFANRGRAKV